MGKLIIDITELAQWQGALSGVPRVINELSVRFARQPNCMFVVWDEVQAQFQETSLQTSPERGVQTKDSSEGGAEPKRGVAKRLVGQVRVLESRSPLIHQALVIPKKVARKVVARPSQAITKASGIVPAPGDTLFVIADWHSSQAFINKVSELKSTGVALVVVSHDMLPIVAPQYSGHATERFTNFVEKVYPLCNAIFAFSENTKKDITTWFNQYQLNVPPIETFRLGDDFKKTSPIKPTGKDFKLIEQSGSNFILCVGTVEARKNHALLYYVYKLAHHKGLELPPIAIVGRQGWLADDIQQIINTDPVTKDKLVFLRNISDEELAWLYTHCLFSVYPSFYEGWGLPIAESISYGVPCVASKSSSMPEIAGKLISYFDPASSDDCLKAISSLLQPNALEEAKQKVKGYKPASWDETFKAISTAIGRIND